MTGRYTFRYGMQYSVVSAGAPWGMPLSEKVSTPLRLFEGLGARDSYLGRLATVTVAVMF